MKNIREFVAWAHNKTSDEIYDMFEHRISQTLRDCIYAQADADTPEPCRSALHNIGRAYNVPSLQSY